MKTAHREVQIQHHKNKTSFVIYKPQPQLIKIIKQFQLFSLCMQIILDKVSFVHDTETIIMGDF